MSTHAIETTDENFDQDVLQAGMPVLVDFWAKWCGPCKMIGPLVDELAKDYEGKLRVVKVNVDDCPETPAKYSVRGIPTLAMFNNGELVDTKVGAMSKAQLQAFVDQCLD